MAEWSLGTFTLLLSSPLAAAGVRMIWARWSKQRGQEVFWDEEDLSQTVIFVLSTEHAGQ